MDFTGLARLAAQPEQKLNIALWALDGRIGKAGGRKAVFRTESGDIAEHGRMHGRVAHHAVFAHLRAAGLKLRLHEGYGLRAGPQEAAHDGSTSLREIKETSTLAKSMGSPTSFSVRPRTLVRSRFTTRGSLRRDHASWP